MSTDPRYLDDDDVIARRKAAQPEWVTDDGRNVNGFILVAWAPGSPQYGTPMIDPADDAYVYVD